MRRFAVLSFPFFLVSYKTRILDYLIMCHEGHFGQGGNEGRVVSHRGRAVSTVCTL